MRAATIVVSLCLGCGGNTGGGENTGGAESQSSASSTETGDEDTSLPPEISAEAFAAFIESERYRGEGWQAETEAPRDASNIVTPHGRVRVFLHDNTVAAHVAGLGTVAGDPLPAGSAAVKEMYDSSDQRVGTAMLYKHLEGDQLDTTTYWCVGPQERCTTVSPEFPASSPLFGPGSENDCGGCHTSLVFTTLP